MTLGMVFTSQHALLELHSLQNFYSMSNTLAGRIIVWKPAFTHLAAVLYLYKFIQNLYLYKFIQNCIYTAVLYLFEWFLVEE